MNESMTQMKNHFWMLKEFLLFKKATFVSVAFFAAILILYMFTLTVSGSSSSLLSITFLMLSIFFFWINVLMGIVLWDRVQSFKKFSKFISYLKPQEIDMYFPSNQEKMEEKMEKQSFVAMIGQAKTKTLDLNSALDHVKQMPNLGKRLSVPGTID